MKTSALFSRFWRHRFSILAHFCPTNRHWRTVLKSGCLQLSTRQWLCSADRCAGAITSETEGSHSSWVYSRHKTLQIKSISSGWAPATRQMWCVCCHQGSFQCFVFGFVFCIHKLTVWLFWSRLSAHTAGLEQKPQEASAAHGSRAWCWFAYSWLNVCFRRPTDRFNYTANQRRAGGGKLADYSP